MTIDWWTLGLQTVNVIALVWLLGRFFWRPLAGMIVAIPALISGSFRQRAMVKRGFSASNFLSSQRLNPIAALRANTMQAMTRRNKPINFQPIPVLTTPRKNPIRANGIAKMVCENLIRLK